MTIETVTYIDDLNATYPAGGDAKSEGDNHIRNLKTGIKNSFPNISGAVTATHTELNTMDGITATTAELNIMDGVTATTAELNTLDSSANAVAGFTYSNIVYIDDDGDGQAGDSLALETVLANGVWETVGPTGSGASNIWTALDNLPTTAKWVEILIHTQVSATATGNRTIATRGRKNGSSGADANTLISTAEAWYESSGTNNPVINVKKIPLDSSNILELKCTTGGSAAAGNRTATAFVVAFGV